MATGNRLDVVAVLIAVDETEESVAAARTARRLFGEHADYTAVSVADVRLDVDVLPWWGSAWGTSYPVPFGGVWPLPGRAATDVESPPVVAGQTPAELGRRAAGDTARDVIEQAGLVGGEPIGETGDPVEAILRASDQHGADVIVVGTHDRSWFGRLLRGSVREGVLEHSDVPVLVIPPGGAGAA